jgi:murein L,D-transpeptidase YcbB/YkuD
MVLSDPICKDDLKGLSANKKAQIEPVIGRMNFLNVGRRLLNRYLSQYQNIQKSGGWPRLTEGLDLKKGDRSRRVAALRSRLVASGDLIEENKGGKDCFGKDLENAVRRFQKRHGLEVDGIVGPVTRTALNVPVKDRIMQIRLNIERWRLLPNDFGWRYILVNITDFKLSVIENNETVLAMKVVVGRESRPTPILSSRITSVELNPFWQIPPTIIRKDILHKIIADPDYLGNANIHVFKSWEKNASKIDPKSINWLQIRPENITFRLQQEPGPSNSLGRIKFIFPNRSEVYLHDTPVRELFQKAKRSSSSGCVRLEKPLKLLKYLFRSGQGWNSEKIIAALNSGKTQILRLPESIPIYFLYWTAWVDDANRLNFRNDIYGRDKLLLEAFKNCRPALHSLKELNNYSPYR